MQSSHSLLDHEQWIADTIEAEYSKEQICAFFLTKTIRCIYQSTDDEVKEWYEAVFELPCGSHVSPRADLVKKYTRALLSEFDYQEHLYHWTKTLKVELCSEMVEFFE